MDVKVVDSHTGGEPTRCVIDGPALLGDTIEAKRRDLATRLDSLRQGIVCEPRGSDIVVGAWLTAPADPSCHAGVVFFNNVGVLNMCGHGTIGVVETLRHLGRLDQCECLLETSSGTVRARLAGDHKVSFVNVPCHRAQKGVTLRLDSGATVSGDVAWGGNWFFLCADHGQSLTLDRAHHLTGLCRQIDQALRANQITGDDGGPIDHIELTSPGDHGPLSGKSFVLCPGAAYDRSPCGTGTSAKVACLAADGKLKPGETWIQESITGSIFRATYQMVEECVVPTIEGSAFVTAEATLIFEDSDPLVWGFTAENPH